MSSKFEVAVIGGGVLGITLAYHLARRKITTVVFERESSFGMHASGKNAGMIRQLYRHSRLTEWANRSITGWPEPVREAAFRRTGSFIAGRTVPVHHQQLFQQQQLVPEASPPGSPILSGVYAAEDGLLDPHTYLSSLYELVDRRYCRFIFSAEVASLQIRSGTWEIKTVRGDRYQASRTVNAAGAWVNAILPAGEEASVQPVAPYCRHLFMIHGWDADFMPHSTTGFYWDEINNWYMRHWDRDTRLVSICDEVPADPDFYSPDPAIGSELAAKLLKVLPGIAQKLSLGRSWHCFRTYTADRLPVFGFDPQLSGLFWLAAFGGFGMSTSFAAAEDAAACLAGEPIPLPAEFLPRRPPRQR